MQDYNYIWHGCMEITLELSCCKFPPSPELPQFWEDNRNSLLRFLGEAHKGVKGFVKDEDGNPIEGASMKVKNRDVGFQTTKEGEFWRIILPGIYTMEIFATGFEPREVQFAIVESNPTLLNVTLFRDTSNRVRPSVINTLDNNEEKIDSDEEKSSLFGLPNPLTGIQTSVKSFFDKLPVIG